MEISRPIIFFDLETTGTSITQDRIVEISIVKLFPGDDALWKRTWRVNPGIPIPAEATNVHHITNEDVAGEKPFAEIAPEIAVIFKDSDIAGFNSNKFDLPLLLEEMARAGVMLDIRDARLIDVQTIYHKKEPRNLSAAYRFYCNKELEDAHSALADTMATYEIFKAQLEKYADLPSSIEELAKFTSFERNVDLIGRFIYNDRREIIVNFGQHKGKRLVDVLTKDPSFYTWMIGRDFPADTKRVVSEAYHTLRR